jgi:hypothetical protein
MAATFSACVNSKCKRTECGKNSTELFQVQSFQNLEKPLENSCNSNSHDHLVSFHPETLRNQKATATRCVTHDGPAIYVILAMDIAWKIGYS